MHRRTLYLLFLLWKALVPPVESLFSTLGKGVDASCFGLVLRCERVRIYGASSGEGWKVQGGDCVPLGEKRPTYII